MADQTTRPETRRPYHGSCHCGHVRYITYLTLPTSFNKPSQQPPASTSRIYKCNCTTCRKMGFFHVRPIDPPADFQVLSPLDLTSGGLKDYTCFSKLNHWYFCSTCGVRCFALSGEGEVRTEDVEGEKKEVWGLKRKEWDDGPGRKYLTINALTLEPKQDGFDLREWVDKGWIAYYDHSEVEEDQMGRPHAGDPY